MGNVCCKPKKAPEKKPSEDVDSERPLDRTQSIFVKSKVDKFKKQTQLIEERNNPDLIPFGNVQRINLDGNSDSDSDLEAKLQSAESSHPDLNMSRMSASRTSVVSRSVSASHGNLDNFHLMKQDQFKKGKIISESEIKTIYQCMHTNTGKLLISKTYRVSFTHF